MAALTPLAFGVWFSFWPTTVPWFVLRLPLKLVNVLSWFEFWTSSSTTSDPFPDDDATPQGPVFDTQTTPDAPPDATAVRLVGVALLVVGFVVAVWLRRHFLPAGR